MFLAFSDIGDIPMLQELGGGGGGGGDLYFLFSDPAMY